MVDYQMMSIDAGYKYKGLSFEGEYYRRWLGDKGLLQHNIYKER
jgi:hypothetical protein